MADELDLIERYRESHQAVARMFASGMTPQMVRQRTGYSFRRLNLLINSPSFQELVAIFTKRIEDKWNENLDSYLDLGMSNMIRAESQIAERLDQAEDEGGEPLPIAILDKISQGRADRFGYSKHAVLEHKHDFASLLDRAIDRSGKREEMKQIEGTVIGRSLPALQARDLTPPSQDSAGREEVVVAQAGSTHVEQRPPRPSFQAILTPIKRRKVA